MGTLFFRLNMDKKKLIQFLISKQQEKLVLCQSAIEEMRNDLASDTKSTAGDKHETARSMTQLEMEKLGKQFIELQKNIDQLQRLLQVKTTTLVSIGSLVRLEKFYVLIGFGLGKISFENSTVFCVSPSTQIAQQLLGKSIKTYVTLPTGSESIQEIL